jgi:hypothetical protein
MNSRMMLSSYRMGDDAYRGSFGSAVTASTARLTPSRRTVYRDYIIRSHRQSPSDETSRVSMDWSKEY